MEELKKILYELNYIYDIYDDIKNTWSVLDDKKNIIKVYNNNDLLLLYKMSKITKYTKTRNLNNGNIEIDFNDMINRYYNIIVNDIQNIDFDNIFIKQMWLNYDSKYYIGETKDILNKYIDNIEYIPYINYELNEN